MRRCPPHCRILEPNDRRVSKGVCRWCGEESEHENAYYNADANPWASTKPTRQQIDYDTVMNEGKRPWVNL